MSFIPINNDPLPPPTSSTPLSHLVTPIQSGSTNNNYIPATSDTIQSILLPLIDEIQSRTQIYYYKLTQYQFYVANNNTNEIQQFNDEEQKLHTLINKLESLIKQYNLQNLSSINDTNTNANKSITELTSELRDKIQSINNTCDQITPTNQHVAQITFSKYVKSTQTQQ